MTDDNARVVGETGVLPRCLEHQRQQAAGSPRCVDVVQGADRRTVALCGSNPARAVGQNPPGADVTAR